MPSKGDAGSDWIIPIKLRHAIGESPDINHFMDVIAAAVRRETESEAVDIVFCQFQTSDNGEWTAVRRSDPDSLEIFLEDLHDVWVASERSRYHVKVILG